MGMVFTITSIDDKKYIVYKHTSPSNKVYIGITCTTPEQRWRCGEGYVNNEYFYRAIKKYGWENIEHCILATGLTEEEAKAEERRLIALYNAQDERYGYNLTGGGDGCWHPSEITKRKMSEAHKGEKHHMYGKRGENSPHFGKHHTEATKQKISNSHMGLRCSDETKRKLSEGRKGQTASDETRRKMSEAHKGKIISEEQRQKISESRKGKNVGSENPNARKVRCIESGVVYATVTDAARENDIDHSGICAACRGRQKTAGGFHWEYVNE